MAQWILHSWQSTLLASEDTMDYMSRSDYLNRMQTDEKWLPGRDAIIEACRESYKNGRTRYIRSTESVEKDVGLDGFCVCRFNSSTIGIATCGLSQIHPNEDAYGRMRSGWGIEFTVRWPAKQLSDCNDAFKLLTRLAQFVQTRKTVPSVYCTLSFSGAIRFPEFKSDSFAGLLIVPDHELETIQTIHGDVRFLQILNITKPELAVLKKHPGMAQQMIFNMQKECPDLLLNPHRSHHYLE